MVKGIDRHATALLLLTSIISTLVPASTFAATSANVFSDVSTSTQYGTAISALKTKGVLAGYSDNSYKPLATINRAEFLKIVLESRGETIPNNSMCFPDVNTEWFSKYVCLAKREGIVGGYPDGMFKPNQTIDFAEASKILALAYKQKMQQTGGEWYVPYVSALEAGRAIPPTVKELTSKLTRGEMAETMWRLTEKKSTLASKGLLNLEHPEATVDFSSDALQVAKSCADLSAFVQEAGKSGMATGRDGRMMKTMDALPPMAAPAAGATANESTAQSADYSHTNIQVEGVDEGDIVKTDGTFVYTISQGKVRIVRAKPASAMKEESVIDFAVSTANGNVMTTSFAPQDLYVDGTKLMVLGQSYENTPYPGPVPMMDRKMAPGGVSMIYPPIYNRNKSEVRIYDLTNPAKPEQVRTVAFEGNTVSTRKISNKLYMVIQQPMNWYHIMDAVQPREKDIVPTFDDSKKGQNIPVAPCGQISILPHVPSPEYITVAVVSTSDMNADVKREVVVGSAQNIYASLNNLYVAMPQWQYAWDAHSGDTTAEKTNIYRFAFVNDGAEMKSQGSVPGHILNQFSMDEHENNFRIATTIQQNWSDAGSKSTNNLFVLDAGLKTIGSITDIAPGESIYSTRFMGDRAYMVTFQQVDPLFVIDTSNPRAPKILGQLKIPGYSNYLHPYDENHVIGFGKDVDASIDKDKVHTDGAVYYTAILGMKVSIFDVTDVANPKEMSKVIIGDRGTDSPLLTDHKALYFDKERGVLAFPVTVMEIPADQKSKPATEQYATPVFQGAYVYDISLTSGLKLRGTVTHYDDKTVFDKAGNYWYGGGRDIKRILRIGDSLISVSDGSIRSHSLSTLNIEGKVEFPVDTNGNGSISRPIPID